MMQILHRSEALFYFARHILSFFEVQRKTYVITAFY